MSFILGTKVVRKSSKIKIIKEEMYYIPLIESLQQLLNNKFILNEVHVCQSVLFPVSVVIWSCLYSCIVYFNVSYMCIP